MLSSIIHREGQSQLAQYFKLLGAGYIIAAPVYTCHHGACPGISLSSVRTDPARMSAGCLSAAVEGSYLMA